MSAVDRPCPVCGGVETTAALEIRNVPAHAVVVYRDRAAAEAAPTGDMRLVCCRSCGFAFNRAFDPRLLHYRDGYESTQAFSGHFNAFSSELAAEILARVGSREKPLLEIGCGQGEFLRLLEAGGHRNLIGFDPAHHPERSALDKGSSVKIFAEAFSPALAAEPPAAIVCKMTLEHIANPLGFLRDIAAVANQSPDCIVFLQVPNAEEIFRIGAFWDVYYEHCSYFTASTLPWLLARAGLRPLDLRTGFGAQYLLLAGRSGRSPSTVARTPPDNALAGFEAFLAKANRMIAAWDEKVDGFDRAGTSVALWGGGSKAVAFLSALERSDAIDYAIDVNPRKSASHLPKSGLKVVSPSMAKKKPTDLIVVMNPNYLTEVRECCAGLGLPAAILPVCGTGEGAPVYGRGGKNLHRSGHA
jgi:2-polyprenyl-3-methyl-5-hydroxy-6-metoxy-1,4-benzoquinol methylase